MKPKIYFGTAGWTYDDWVGVFYPKRQSKEFDYLTFYSNCFNCVEVNATYYRYMSPNTVKSWVNKLSDNGEFTFSIKANMDFTHKKIFNDTNIKDFYSTIDILNKSGLLAGVLLQFPYSYSFNSPNVEHLKKLNEIFSGTNQFLEIRHTSWLNSESLSLLSELGITLSTIDQPQIGQALNFQPLLTTNKAYFRFHGRNSSAWKYSITNFGKEQTHQEQNERYNYLYSPGELIEISQKIKEIYDKVKEIYVIMNNHPQGNAVANAFELMKMLDNQMKINVPEATKLKYKRLAN